VRSGSCSVGVQRTRTQFLFSGAGMFSDYPILASAADQMAFPTKFHNGDSKYKLMYEGIVIRDS
jgi:hypothetical protein